MSKADDCAQMSEQLRTHRRTLAIRLQQLAAHAPAPAPPIIFHDIDYARTQIAHLKRDLAALDAPANDMTGDIETPDERTMRAAAGTTQFISGNNNVQANNSKVNVTYNYISGDSPVAGELPALIPSVERPNLLPMAMNLIGRSAEREHVIFASHPVFTRC